MEADLLESTAGDFSTPITARSARGRSADNRPADVPDPLHPVRAMGNSDPVGRRAFRDGVAARSAAISPEGMAMPADAIITARLQGRISRRAAHLLIAEPHFVTSPEAGAFQFLGAMKTIAAAMPRKPIGLNVMKAVAKKPALKFIGGMKAVVQAQAAAHIFLRGLTKEQLRTMLKHVPSLKQLPTPTLKAISGLNAVDTSGLNFSRTMGPAPHLWQGSGPVPHLNDAGALDFSGVVPVYVVESGDFPSKIAQKLTGDSSRWPELIAANPQKAKGSDGNFKTLFANEKLNLPITWLPLVASQAPTGIPGLPTQLPGIPSVPGLPSVPGVPTSPSSGTTSGGQFTYTVQSGDFPAKIAQKLTGQSAKWPELVNENCPPKKKQTSTIITMTGPPDDEGDPTPETVPNPNAGNFTTLNAGEILKVPLSWNSNLNIGTPGLNPPPGGATPVPAGSPTQTPTTPVSVPVPVPPPQPTIPVPLPGGGSVPLPPPISTGSPIPIPGNPSTTMDPATMAQVQADLATWRKLVPGQCNPGDYGTETSEFTGTDTPRTHSALASFQSWYNVAHPLGTFAPGTTTIPASLRTDGTLDQLTYIALHGTVVKLLTVQDKSDKKSGGGGFMLALAGFGALSQVIK